MLCAHIVSRPSKRGAETRREGRETWLPCSGACVGGTLSSRLGAGRARHTQRERGALQGWASMSKATTWEALPSQGTDRESMWLEGRLPEKPVGNNGTAINQSRP